MRNFILIAAALAGPALAQEVRVSPGPVPDTAGMARIADVTAAMAAQRVAIEAEIPAACAAAPSPDSVTGTVGTGAPCVAKADAARPARGQWTRGVTDATCQITWNWKTSYAIPVLGVTTQDTGNPVIWSITAISATSATLKAARLRPLPAVIGLVSALVSYDVAAGSCTGITAHLSVREQLVAP